MNFNPLVSIIIPVFNGANFLKEAIDSALNQTYTNCEIIVVNDGSTDNGKTEKIAKSYVNKIRYFYKPNGGVSSAFNLGIKNMKGDYFSWLSHDDVYYPFKIEEQIDFLRKQENKKVIVFANTDYIDEKSQLIKHSKNLDIDVSNLRFNLLIKRQLINGNTTLIPRECFEKIGLFDEMLKTTQDYDMWFRLSKKFEFGYLNKALVKTRIHSEQGSKTILHFTEEANNLLKKQLESIDDFELLELSKETNIIIFLFKLSIKYSLNGGNKAGWPTDYSIERLRKKVKKNLIYRIVFFNAKIICNLIEFPYSRKLWKKLTKNIKIFYFKIN